MAPRPKPNLHYNSTGINIDALIKALHDSPGGSSDIARYIAMNAAVDWNRVAGYKFGQKPGSGGDTKHGPSVISRILDILARPNYAVANAVLEGGKEHNPLTAFWRGLSGQDKTLFSDVLEQGYGVENPVAKYGLGFALDVALDPTTYIGPGAVKAVGKGIGLGGKAAKVAEESSKIAPEILGTGIHSPVVTQAVKDLAKSKTAIPLERNIAPEINLADSNAVLRAGQTVPIGNISANIPGDVLRNLDINLPVKSDEVFEALPKGKKLPKSVSEASDPELAYSKFKEAFTEQMRKGRAKKRPLVSKGVVNVDRAEDVIDKLAKGDISPVVKSTPSFVPKEASGFEKFTALETARKYADEVVKQPNKYSKISGKAPSPMNPAQQANLFERLKYEAAGILKQTKGVKNPHSKKFAAARFTIAHRMLTTAEDYFTKQGWAPTFWDGSHLKLSDVINELGGPTHVTNEHMTQLLTAMRNNNPHLITNPDVKAAFEKLRAASAIKDSQWVKTAIEATAQKVPVAQQVLSDSKYAKFVKDLLDQNKTFMKGADASPAGTKAGQKLLNDIFLRSGTPVQMATHSQRVAIQRFVAGDKVKWNKVQSAQTNALNNMIGTTARSAGTKVGEEENKAVDFFMSRFASWWGQKDLRPEVLIHTQTAMATTSKKAALWNSVARNFSPEEQAEAFKLAQGTNLPPSSQKVLELSQLFAKEIENMFRASGVTDEAERAVSQFGTVSEAKKLKKSATQKEKHLARNGVDTSLASKNVELANTLALRAGMVIDDINKQLKILKSDFQFSRGIIKDKMGNTTDYSNGTDWLKSWERASVADPLDFMYKLQLASEQVTHKYAFMDEVAARWGSSKRGGEFTRTPQHIRMLGTYLPADINNQLHIALKNWDQIYNPKSPLVSYLDRVTRTWKSAVTIYAPSHHIRNFIGDVYNSWIAGVNNPSVYNSAGRVLYSQKDRYRDLEDINNLVGKDAISRAMTKPGDVIITMKNGQDLTAEQIYVAAFNTGLLPQAHAIEELFGAPLIKFQPLGGRGHATATGVSENREHYVRLAHFIDYLKKTKEKDLQTAFKSASKTVRRWHPDGMDLTDFERNVARRILPFYSWTRKTIPLIIEGAVTKPGKVTTYPKGMFALQGMLGIQSDTWADPFPQDQLFPEWIRNKGIGPLMGAAGDYGIINPSNPTLDIISQFSNPKEGLTSMVNPLYRIPAEVATGNTVLGAPIDANPSKYAINQIPGLSNYYRMTGWSTKDTNDVLNQPGIINFLTALGIQPTKPYIKQAEYEKRGR